MKENGVPMKILICDDEVFFLEMLADYCERYERENHIPICLVKFTDGLSLLEYYRKNKDVDLCILDIMMKEINGLQVANEIRKEGARTKIVFLTTALKYAPRGYDVGAKRYWMKPLTYEKFSSDLAILYNEILADSDLFIVEHIGTAIEKVYFDDIIYIETHGRKTFVHKKEGSYISKTTMSNYEILLDSRFYRCHAAYIVNMYYINKIQGLNVLLKNGEHIFISKSRRSKFIDSYIEFLQGI